MTFDDLKRFVLRLEDELVGIRRRLGRLEDAGRDEHTRVGLPPPPPVPTRTDPYRISDMDDEPTRREKRPL